MENRVDILVPSWRSLPWLVLQWNAICRFLPKVPINYVVWDNDPSPLSTEWIKSQGFLSRSSNPPKSHPASLEELVKISNAPIIAFMDADCIPIKEGWLDEAVYWANVQHIGAAGLLNDHVHAKHREFVHPSFCVFKREVYENLRLSVMPLMWPDRDYFDVCSLMSMVLEFRGYTLKGLGRAFADTKNLTQKLFHFCGSTKGTVGEEKHEDEGRVGIVKRHLDCLADLGLLEEFLGIVRACLPDNSLLNRYLIPGGGK